MLDKLFYCKDESLTAYSFACGYIMRYEKNGVQVKIWREHHTYHVSCYNFNTGRRIFWESFDLITPAKKLYFQYADYIEKNV